MVAPGRGGYISTRVRYAHEGATHDRPWSHAMDADGDAGLLRDGSDPLQCRLEVGRRRGRRRLVCAERQGQVGRSDVDGVDLRGGADGFDAVQVFPGLDHHDAGDGVVGQPRRGAVNGSGSQTDPAARWGDYTSMNVDPADNCRFWYVNEYYQTTSARGWQTRIAAFHLPGCT